jgi:hypothetical protein
MPKRCVETWKYWGQIESFWHPGNTRDPFFWVAILRVPVFVAAFKIYQIYQFFNWAIDFLLVMSSFVLVVPYNVPIKHIFKFRSFAALHPFNIIQ